MKNIKKLFTSNSARSTIGSGRRAKWWKRVGGKASGFKYEYHDKKQITDIAALERISLMVIPPAWKYVRIAPTAGAKIQAVGMDTSGRIQYIYHPNYARKQQRKKFGKIIEFGENLPQLRATTNADISLEGLPKAKVIAIVLRLINSLYFRVGSEKSAKFYRTYGITTLKNGHLTITRNGALKFDFVGKSYVRHRKVLVDTELAEALRVLRTVGPKKKLFCYLDEDGNVKPVKPSDINAYIKAATHSSFSSKDFRTWGATVLAASNLAEIGPSELESDIKKNIVEAVKFVAKELGNTPAVCRTSYIHPLVLESYEKGVTIEDFTPRRSRRIKRIQSDYEVEETALLKLLRSKDK